MNRIYYVVALISLLFTFTSKAQVYILNEDFSDAQNVTGPSNWSNLTVSGAATNDKWRFENPDSATTYPISGKAAYFNGYQFSDNGLPEIISLESPFLDCSISSNVLLLFDQRISDTVNTPDCKVEYYNGFTWQTAAQYSTSSTANDPVVINMSSLIGGLTNAKIRFTWTGNGTGSWMIDNVKVFSPLSLDLSISALDAPLKPFMENFHSVKIKIQNQGIQNVTSANIQWSIDNVVQPAFNWTGNLAIGQSLSNVNIGSHYFPTGEVKDFKIWINSVNGQLDLNQQNDSLITKVSAGLCGTFNVGGAYAFYTDFNKANEALNVGGVVCSVNFLVTGMFNQQILINTITGSASDKWVTFKAESESIPQNDSSNTGLNYTDPNISDYTLIISGAQYVKFKDLSIRRGGGTENIILQGGSSHITFENCLTGKIAALDDANNFDIIIRNTNLQNHDIDIRQPEEGGQGSVIIEGCNVGNTTPGNVYVNRSSPVSIINSNFGRAELYHLDTVQVSGSVFIAPNFGVHAENISNMNFLQNTVTAGFHCEERALRLINVRNSLVKENTISIRGNCDWGGSQVHIGVHVGGGDSRNVTIRDNIIQRAVNYASWGDDWFWGVYTDGGGDSIYIKSNQLNGREITSTRFGKGLVLTGSYGLIEADSNIITKFQNIGAELNSPSANNWKFRYNQLNFIKETGIQISGGNIHCIGNKVWDIRAGAACRIFGNNHLIANNYFNALGPGVAKGIELADNANNNQILYNSVYITGTNLYTAVAVDFLGGSANTIKNNIFYNGKNGRVLRMTSSFLTNNNVMDFNNLRSMGASFAFIDDQEIDDLAAHQNLTGFDNQSISVNPFFIGIDNLTPNHIELNEAAELNALVIKDIANVNRGANPDLGAKQFTPCNRDAGVSEIIDLLGSVSTGVHNIEVKLQNHGQTAITSAVVRWSVNGQMMPNYNWSGNLTSSSSQNVVVGTYNFLSASQYDIRVWTTSPNGSTDCDHYNDTSKVFVATPLCGEYSLGNPNSDFTDFADAVEALNNSLITCPVIFNVETGIYNEQVTLYEVQGSSEVNTITFRSVEEDSTSAQLKYSVLNTENDFTIMLFGAKHLYFDQMTVSRLNGDRAILIDGDCEDLHFVHSILGHTVAVNSTDRKSGIVFDQNAMGGVTMYDLDSLVMSNNIGREDIQNAYRIGLYIENSKDLYFEGNRFGLTSFTNDTLLTFYGNNFRNADESDGKGIYLNACANVVIDSNSVFMNNGCNIKAIHINQTKDVMIRNNNIMSRAGGCWGLSSTGILLSGNATREVTIRDNVIGRPSDWPGDNDNYAILSDNVGDSVFIKSNDIVGQTPHKPGYGIVAYGSGMTMEIDSNRVENIMKQAISVNAPIGNNWKVRENLIRYTRDHGILNSGHGVEIKNNTIAYVNGGNGITVDADSCFVMNNSVHSTGLGVGNGIVVKANAQHSKILFNSVNVTSKDLVNAAALRIEASVSAEIKNNIFSNKEGGFALAIMAPVEGVALDYNDYFSSKDRVAYYLSETYPDLTTFSALSGMETHGRVYNPFYQSDTLLYANHGLLNNVGVTGTGVQQDIVGVFRGVTPDLGIKEFNLCPKDAGVEQFLGLANPLPVANQTIQVRLRNHGIQALTSTEIHWSVNGIEQTPYSWSGNIVSLGSADVSLGNVTFEQGTAYTFKAWTTLVNNFADCNHYNDTCLVTDFGTQMCGVYTLGGENPDFATFTDAAALLNNAGIFCPVIIDVRDGIYNEQIFLTQIPGTSAYNTVTFRGESGDSAIAQIFYQPANTATDFTINLIGTDYVRFEHLGIRRDNGDLAVYASQGSHNLVFDHCWLSKVFSPETSLDTNFVFTHNNIEGKDVIIKSPAGSPKSRFVFQDNYVSSLEVSCNKPLIVTNNRGSAAVDSRSSFFTFNDFQNGLIQGNRCNGISGVNGRNLNVMDNYIYRTGWDYDVKGLYLENIITGVVDNNDINMREGHQSKAIRLNACRNFVLSDNDCLASTANPSWENVGGCYGVLITNNSKNIQVNDNSFARSPDQYWGAEETFYGIYADSGDSLYLRRNFIDGFTITNIKHGNGIYLTGVSKVLLCDSNTVVNCQNRGIYTNAPVLSNWKITRNTIMGVRDAGALLEGRRVRFDSNRIYNMEGGTGIVVNGNQHLVANNFIHARGSGNAKGISLRPGGSNSRIVFNSVSITGTNVVNGRALEIMGGNNYLIKDNIFANTGGGYAAYIVNMPSVKSIDFNDYFSSGDQFGYFANQNYSQIGQWSTVVNGDVNSKEVAPYYESATSFLPYQRELNGAGGAAAGILLDIEPEIRNQQAPDIGAEEFMVDFGVNQLITPTNECEHTAYEPVTILLKQFGDIPFQNIEVSYTINNGPVQTEIIPGSINNDIEYTFDGTQDLSAQGEYLFKIWLNLPGPQDDNINNDTLVVIRRTAEAPNVTFSYTAGCSNEPVVFNANANIAVGSVELFEWNFGAGDSSSVLPAQVEYLYPNSEVYYATVRAFSDQQCYAEFGDSIYMLDTPIADFLVLNHCEGNTMTTENNSETFGSTPDYFWNFGDNVTSNLISPLHQYAQSGNYEVSLIVSNALGCSDTAYESVIVYDTPSLNLNLLSSYPRNVGNIYLVGEPYGGTFSGNGVMGNIFNPMAIPNLNSTTITYQYTDPVTGCANTVSNNVNITPNVSGTAIIMQPTSEQVCLGDMVILFVQAYGPNLQYQWYRNNVIIPNATQSVLIYNSATMYQMASYRVRVTSSTTSIWSSTVNIQILSNYSDQYQTACDQYTWGLTGETYYESGIYTWEGENVSGCDSTVYLHLTINKAFLYANVPYTICEGMGVEINVENLASGSMLWTDGSVEDDWNTTLLQTSTIYATSIVDGISCQESISFNVMQHDMPLNFISNDSLGYCGDSAIVHLPFSEFEYDWEHGLFDSTAVMKNSGWYYASLSNSYCSVYDSVWIELLKADIFTNDTLICEQTAPSLLVGASNIFNLGDVNVFNGDTLIVDAIKSAVLGINLQGQEWLDVDNTYGFQGGDHVVIINMMGPNTGTYQYNFIQSVSDGSLQMQEALSVDFISDAVSKAQVLKILHYGEMIVSGVVTCEPWDGSIGGVLPLYVDGTIIVNDGGKIEANYKGFSGGAVSSSWGVGMQGGSPLALGINTYLANGSGGGGGNAEYCHSGQGGGGGGFVISGGNGGAPCMQCGGGWSVGDCSTSGFGGAANTNLNGIFLGSGGGSGGQDGDNPDGGGKGGNGGGIVLIHASEILGEGLVESKGENGDNGYGETGGGGGGSGGTIHLYSTNISVPYSVNGGQGGKQGDSRFGGNGSPGIAETFEFVPVSNVDLLWSTGDTTTSIAPVLAGSQWISLAVARNGFVCIDSVFIEVQPNVIPAILMAEDSLGICGSEVNVGSDVNGFELLWNGSVLADSITVYHDSWTYLRSKDGVCFREDSIWVSLLNPEIIVSSATICEGATIQLGAIGDWDNLLLDSMNVVGDDWNVPTYTEVNGDSILGPFANVDLKLEIPLWEHDSLEVSFDLYPFDTWDYNEPFEVYLNDDLIATAVFNSGGCSNASFINQGCANGFCASTATCYPFYRFTYKLADSSDSLKLRINQYNGQELCDESWGIDNVRVDLYLERNLEWSTGVSDALVEITPDSSSMYTLAMSNSLVSCFDSAFITVYPSDTTVLTVIIPADSTYILGGQQITVPGDYQEVFTSISGCDSLVQLHLEHELICDLQVSLDSICQGNEISLTSILSGGFSSGYTWSINNDHNVVSLIQNPQADSVYVLNVASGIQTCSDTAFVEVSPATMYFIDSDLDAYGAGVPVGFCADPGTGYVLNALDCADNNAAVNPVGIEICSNGWDDDCVNGDLDCANTGPGIAIVIPTISQWGVGSQTTINVNLTNGVNNVQSQGNGLELWYEFVAQTNAVRIAYKGSLTSEDDNKLMLYSENPNYSMQWVPLSTEDDVQPGNVGTMNADGGSEILYFDQLTIGVTYFLCIQNTNDVPSTGVLTISYLYGSMPDVLPYTQNTGIYSNTCQNFKAKFRPNAFSYTVNRWSTPAFEGVPVWTYTIPSVNFAATGVANTVCQMGMLVPANLTGVTQNLHFSVDVLYQLKDAFGNNNMVIGRANVMGAVGLSSEAGLFVRTSDQCPVFKNPTFGSIATNRSVCGTKNYEWSFTMQSPSVSLPITISGPVGASRILGLNSVMGIANGQRYDVKIRSRHLDNVSTTAWGEIKCVKTVGSAGMPTEDQNQVLWQGQMKDISALVYPNPNSGQSANLIIDGVSGELSIRVLDPVGREVYNHLVWTEGKALVNMDFKEVLSSGMYLIELKNNGRIAAFGMMVAR